MQTDGRLALQDGSSSFASVLVFAADVDTRELGQVFFRESTDPDLLLEVGDLVGEVLTDFLNNPPLSLFITTWFYVGHYNQSVERVQ